MSGLLLMVICLVRSKQRRLGAYKIYEVNITYGIKPILKSSYLLRMNWT